VSSHELGIAAVVTLTVMGGLIAYDYWHSKGKP
jgi:hypothetical protein